MLFSRGHLNCGSLPRMEFIEVGRVWRYCWCGFNIRRSPSRCRKIYGKTPKYLLRCRCFRYPLGGQNIFSGGLGCLYGTSGAYFGPTVMKELLGAGNGAYLLMEILQVFTGEEDQVDGSSLKLTASLHLKMDGWKMIVSFQDGLT